MLGLDQAWEFFGWRNGDPDPLRFLERIGAYRGLDLRDPATPPAPLGCTILRDAMFWPPERWIPWPTGDAWPRQVVRGRTERDPARASRLLAEVQYDHAAPPEELRPEPFQPLAADECQVVLDPHAARQGQGSFGARVLDAYERACAVTGEHTEIVLEAAHIQPYLGPRSNHVQNGLLLTREFHALFDRGYVTVTPDHVLRVSRRLKAEWKNGRRYYPYDGCRIRLPRTPELRPAAEVLAWHARERFLA